MRIKTKLWSNNLGLCGLVTVAGLVGLLGLQRLTATMEAITGPGWGTADAAMETSIAVAKQVLAIDRIVAGIDVEANQKLLREALAKADSCRQELQAAGILTAEQLTAQERAIRQFGKEIEQLLDGHQKLVDRRVALRANDQALVVLSDQVESIGDNAIERLQQEPQKPVTWQGDLDASWNAADSSMEGRIAMLEQMFWVGCIEAGKDVDQARQKVGQRQVDLQACLQRMIASKAFEQPLQGGRGTLVEAYGQLLAVRPRLTEDYLDSLQKFEQQRRDFESSAADLQRFLSDLESSTDQVMEREIQGAQALETSLNWTLVLTGLGSVALGITVGVLLTRSLGSRLGRLEASLRDIAAGEGDLTVRLDASAKDELGGIAGWFNQFLGKLQTTVRGIAQKATGVASAASDMTTTASSLAKGAEVTKAHTSQAAAAAEQMSANMRSVGNSTESMSGAIRTVAAAVEEMTASITEVAKNAEDAAQIANTAAQLTRSSNEKVAALGAAANEIGRVIESIQDIAEQTNLLALNATIEAARAGEAGKGFSVVANEVKDLARQTADATQDIRKRIERIQASTSESVAAIGEIDQVIAKVSSTSQQIASSVGEQRTATQEISQNLAQSTKAIEVVAGNVREGVTASEEMSRAVVEVDGQAQATASGADQAAGAGKGLAALAGELQSLVGQFKV